MIKKLPCALVLLLSNSGLVDSPSLRFTCLQLKRLRLSVAYCTAPSSLKWFRVSSPLKICTFSRQRCDFALVTSSGESALHLEILETIKAVAQLVVGHKPYILFYQCIKVLKLTFAALAGQAQGAMKQTSCSRFWSTVLLAFVLLIAGLPHSNGAA